MISRLKNVFKLGRKSKKEPIATTGQEEYLNEEDDPNQIQPHSKSRRLVWILYSALLVIFFGGAGIVFGWVLVNAEKTIEKRIAMTPAVTVEVLADDETAPKNSSKEQSQAKDQRIEDGSDKTIMEKSEKPKDTSGDRDALVGIIFPHITEETEDGPLPIIAADGRQPWLEYSRGFKRADRKPRIALIVTNLGLSATYTKAALKLLPEDITLSFSHVAPRLKS